MVDIWPEKSAAASAANNFVRCSLGAAASAAIDPMSKAMGRGWAYTTVALLQAAAVPFLVVLMSRGVQMRKAKAERRLRKEIRKEGDREEARETLNQSILASRKHPAGGPQS